MTIASALDHLTDVLANKDVAGYQTIEQSIIRIADMITDGEIIIGGSISPATADTLGGVKIGEGISVTSDGTISAGGGTQSGTYTFSIWNVDSDGNITTDGDYATARALLEDEKPILAFIFTYNLDPSAPGFAIGSTFDVALEENGIKLPVDSSYGYLWNGEGITQYGV